MLKTKRPAAPKAKKSQKRQKGSTKRLKVIFPSGRLKVKNAPVIRTLKSVSLGKEVIYVSGRFE